MIFTHLLIERFDSIEWQLFEFFKKATFEKILKLTDYSDEKIDSMISYMENFNDKMSVKIL